MYDDMPALVDANTRGAQIIPPPPGATMLAGGQAPFAAPTSAPQYPWGAAFPRYALSMPQTSSPSRSYNYYDSQAYPQPSMPSPYIPRQPLVAEAQPHDPFAPRRRAHSFTAAPSSSRKRANPLHGHSPWPSEGDLSPLFDQPGRRPSMHAYASYQADMHTPSSTLSRSTATSGSPHEVYYERPGQWRRDFKFKSGLASILRTMSNNTRTLSEFTDSSKLNLHPCLRYDRANPPTIYDLRRNPLTLVFRELDRPPLANDMIPSATLPHTQYMRLYHTTLKLIPDGKRLLTGSWDQTLKSWGSAAGEIVKFSELICTEQNNNSLLDDAASRFSGWYNEPIGRCVISVVVPHIKLMRF
ncbi:hypothetical protein BU15DRAFT_75578 [Melanogaster broomeanus]|nr:hypothetical protein BU15DRAFT_75578 [Melanogaster broomeanus]